MLHRTAGWAADADAATEPELTPRERQVAELVAQGLTNEQIAQHLVITPGTAANHVRHILTKLGLHSRVQLATRIVTSPSAGRDDEVLALLARLQNVGATDLPGALQHATDVLAAVFAADKVDALLYDPSAERLVARGTSRTPLGERQHALGLDRLPLAQGGRAAWVFHERRSFRDGHVERDAFELIGVRRDLGVRSTLAVPLEIGARHRGVLLVSARAPEHFSDQQLRLLQFVAYWVGLVAQRHAEDQASG
jgi:DNA-binding CsgD family transcriptional regulator